MRPLIKPSELARELGVSRAWVYESARSGRIPSIRIGGDDGPLRFAALVLFPWVR
jgi:excisionase family DNA binding protein